MSEDMDDGARASVLNINVARRSHDEGWLQSKEPVSHLGTIVF